MIRFLFYLFFFNAVNSLFVVIVAIVVKTEVLKCQGKYVCPCERGPVGYMEVCEMGRRRLERQETKKIPFFLVRDAGLGVKFGSLDAMVRKRKQLWGESWVDHTTKTMDIATVNVFAVVC